MTKICVAQINFTVGDINGNTKKILDSIAKAQVQGIDLILFSELSLCGYPPEDLVFHRSFIASMQLHLERIIKASKGIIVLVGIVRERDFEGEKAFLNSAAIIYDEKLIGFQDKALLPTYDVFNERRYFEPGIENKPWEVAGHKFGVVICEDIWQHAGFIEYTQYFRDPIQELAEHKLDFLLNLTASPYQCQKPDVRVEVCSIAAKTLKCPVVMCCQVGANDQIIFDGYSIHVDAQGTLVNLAKGFTDDEMCIDLNSGLKQTSFQYHPKDNLLSALTLGVKDYFAKCNFTKACFGLPGGIDSALVAYIAAEALGKENVLSIFMPSKYTSEQSKHDAQALSKNLGMELIEIPIEPLMDQFLNTMHPFFKGKKEDVTEENMQARIRGNILMAMSNKHGHIVLSTGNKSESALGFSTLYGDMCGGLAVIGDVNKTQVYDLCRHINSKNGKDIIPHSVITKPPSAELRPNQIDLDRLPEYGIIDNILERYVENY
ncbi:NAD+ synthase, partial [Candidatus Aerophobetes bacterium]